MVFDYIKAWFGFGAFYLHLNFLCLVSNSGIFEIQESLRHVSSTNNVKYDGVAVVSTRVVHLDLVEYKYVEWATV